MSDDKLQIQEAQKIQRRIKHKLKNILYLEQDMVASSYNPTILDYTGKPCTDIKLIKSYQSTLTSVCSNYRKLMVNTK